MRNILLITGLLVLSIVLRAQNIQLSGVVKDRSDSSALIGANVAIKSLPDSITIAVVSTNADGAYKIGDSWVLILRQILQSSWRVMELRWKVLK